MNAISSGIRFAVRRTVMYSLRPLKMALTREQKWKLAVMRHTWNELHHRVVAFPHTCPICGFAGLFGPFGWPIRPEAYCPSCGALERHRLLKLWLDENATAVKAKRILHFAPEATVSTFVKPMAATYQTADIEPGRAELALNIEQMALEDASYEVVICSHVLEHVNDRQALAELNRVLTSGGQLLLMVPIVEGWQRTYVNPAIISPEMREVHFGQSDHVRYYGADFRLRIEEAGFKLQEFTAEEPFVSRYGLLRGEKLFVASK